MCTRAAFNTTHTCWPSLLLRSHPRCSTYTLCCRANLQDYYHTPHNDAEQGGLLARDYYLSQGAADAAAGQAPGTGLRENAAYDSAIGAGDAYDTNRSSVTFIVYAISIMLTMGVSLGVWPGVTAFFCR